MTKLYEKNETAFAVMWILIYIFGTCLAEALSEMAGIYKLFPAIFHGNTGFSFPDTGSPRPGFSCRWYWLPAIRLFSARHCVTRLWNPCCL